LVRRKVCGELVVCQRFPVRASAPGDVGAGVGTGTVVVAGTVVVVVVRTEVVVVGVGDAVGAAAELPAHDAQAKTRRLARSQSSSGVHKMAAAPV
jgi:hypothetical protein